MVQFMHGCSLYSSPKYWPNITSCNSDGNGVHSDVHRQNVFVKWFSSCVDAALLFAEMLAECQNVCQTLLHVIQMEILFTVVFVKMFRKRYFVFAK